MKQHRKTDINHFNSSKHHKLRLRVINAVKAGETRAEAAERFGVAKCSVYRWQKRIDAEKAGPKSARKIDMQALKEHISAHPDAYLGERADLFGVTPSGIWRAMQRLGVTKKNVDVR